jgi:hypothetical protein
VPTSGFTAQYPGSDLEAYSHRQGCLFQSMEEAYTRYGGRERRYLEDQRSTPLLQITHYLTSSVQAKDPRETHTGIPPAAHQIRQLGSHTGPKLCPLEEARNDHGCKLVTALYGRHIKVGTLRLIALGTQVGSDQGREEVAQFAETSDQGWTPIAKLACITGNHRVGGQCGRAKGPKCCREQQGVFNTPHEGVANRNTGGP